MVQRQSDASSFTKILHKNINDVQLTAGFFLVWRLNVQFKDLNNYLFSRLAM